MALADMISSFQTILSRDDCSAAQAQTFVLQGIARVQRTCRLPSMERSLLITPSANMQSFPVPVDLLEIIDVIALDPTGVFPLVLEHVSYRALAKYLPQPMLPRYYARLQTQIWLAGMAPAGVPLTFNYYGNFTPFATLAGENELSSSTPDLGVYAALRYAGDYFQHPSTDAWEQTYQQIRGEVIQMASDLENNGGVNYVRPLYNED